MQRRKEGFFEKTRFLTILILLVGAQLSCNFVQPSQPMATPTHTATVTTTPAPTHTAKPQTTPTPPANTTNLPDTENIIACYPFNGNADDASHHGYNGVVMGAELTKDRFGNPDSAYYFDGNGSYIQIPIGSNDFESDFTIAVWVKFQNFGADYPHILSGEQAFVVFHGMGPVYGMNKQHLGFYQQNSLAYTGNNRIGLMLSEAELMPQKWYMIAVTRQKQFYTLYLNGQKDTSLEDTKTFDLTGKWITIGASIQDTSSLSNDSLTGSIDDLCFYNQALNQEQIATQYQNQVK